MNATDDWYDVSRLTERSDRIDEAGDYGMFLIEGEDRSVLVDAGAGVGDLRRLVEGLVDTPVTLVLTHTHWDHIGAAAGFDDVRVAPAELPADGRITIDSHSDEFVDRPAAFAKRWTDHGYEFPDGVDPGTYAIDPADATALSLEGGLDLGDRTLDVVELPGHSPGQVGLLDPATKTLYGGDVIHVDYDLYVMFERCDLGAYIDSFERVRDLRDRGAFDTLVTSHNEPFSGDSLSIVDDLLEGLREIAAEEREHETVETDWGPARSYRIGRSNVLLPAAAD